MKKLFQRLKAFCLPGTVKSDPMDEAVKKDDETFGTSEAYDYCPEAQEEELCRQTRIDDGPLGFFPNPVETPTEPKSYEYKITYVYEKKKPRKKKMNVKGKPIKKVAKKKTTKKVTKRATRSKRK